MSLETPVFAEWLLATWGIALLILGFAIHSKNKRNMLHWGLPAAVAIIGIPVGIFLLAPNLLNSGPRKLILLPPPVGNTSSEG